MALHLSGKIETEFNIENMINELRRYLQIVTGKKVDKIDTVAFALLYTIHNVKDTELIDKISDVNYVNKSIINFRNNTRPVIENVLKSVVSQEV